MYDDDDDDDVVEYTHIVYYVMCGMYTTYE